MPQDQNTLADSLEAWSKSDLDICLSLTLLFLMFAFKLFVDKTFGSKDLMQSLCELPIDIVFSALAFMIAFTVSNKHNAAEIGIIIYTVIIVFALLILVGGRRAGRFFENRKPVMGTIFLVISLLVSLYILVESIEIFNKQASDIETTKVVYNNK